jgi:AAA domain
MMHVTNAIRQHSSTQRDNILIEACGLPLEPVEIGKRLIYLPPQPEPGVTISDHELFDILRMHIPTATGIELARTIGLMLRQGYVHRNPSSPATWRQIYSGIGAQAAFSPIQLGATVTGISGAGKSTAIEKALHLYPQVVTHEKVPGLANPCQQLLWLKIDVPYTGKTADLVDNLARATDAALGTSHAKDLFSGRRQTGVALAHQWLQKVSCNFLGLLVLDEVQNLFRVQNKEVRMAAKRSKTGIRPELRVADDETLKFLLTLSNFAKVPTLYCATPDGMAAFETRMSTAQRMLTAGFHTMPHAESADDEFFRKRLFPVLCRYQWLPDRLPVSDELRRLIFELSAGVPKFAVLTWIHAHRRAIQRHARVLTLEDFRHAAENALAPLRSPVAALLSNDPMRLQRYEDLMGSFREWGPGGA